MTKRFAEASSPSASETAAKAGDASGAIAALINLGFSQYEARTYAGLVGREAMTGYAVAKATQVPQPKCYETLGRLVERGAVLQISDSPAKFIAVPPARVIAELETSFRQRISTVEVEISRMRPDASGPQALRPFREASSWMAIATAANHIVDSTEERLYVSGHSTYLEPLADAVGRADRRGVRTDVLCFGEPPFTLQHGNVTRHSSTDGIVYRHHQARHLAVSGDSDAGLWALALDGEHWEGIWSDEDALLTALVKGFIRHDTFMQRVYHDFSDEMGERYGAGLEGLFDWEPTAAAGQPNASRATRAQGKRRPA
jgi:HTH-type transcriptional regulator, sugar sensing transcriptional regulator